MPRQADSSPAQQSIKSDVPEVLLVQSLREQSAGTQQAKALCEQLLRRCEPMFQRHVRGLLHRPDLREEALANMREHLLREAMDPKEIFITQNFPHYLQCVAHEEFTRILRQEGLLPYQDERPRKGNRPERIPRSLTVRLPAGDAEYGWEGGSAEGRGMEPLLEDPCETWLAGMEVRRLVGYLEDPLDRSILILRAIEGYKWDDIASICCCSGRTARLRYDHIRAFLCAALQREHEAEQQGQGAVLELRLHSSSLVRMSAKERHLRNQMEQAQHKRHDVIEAIIALRRAGLRVTRDAVMHRANISITFLRAHTDLMQKIEDGLV